MYTRKQRMILAVLAGLSLLLIGWVLLGPPQRTALAALPPRPTPTPVIKKAAETGGYIKLQVDDAPAGLWTVVQWEDAQGDWHDVTGWQGTLDDGRTKLWWVAPKDFATGPFRWVAYDASEGKLLGVSAAFSLPVRVKEVIQADLVLDSSVE